MAPQFDRALRETLGAAGCTFVRQGKGSHEIWYSPITKRNFAVPSESEPSHSEQHSAASGACRRHFEPHPMDCPDVVTTPQSAALPARDRITMRALAARMRGAGKHKPILLTGRNAGAAADALARELRLKLYRVDLSAVVSKYIGETEKNLARVFDAAEAAHSSLLLFDEADALFGKRDAVKDAHDRFANLEIRYLLERIDRYRRLVVLVSRSRRPLPAALRVRLWMECFCACGRRQAPRPVPPG
jgi:hypothetical protein